FFFQAEDGIRDRTVTGVQTCALPICETLNREFDVKQNELREQERRLEKREDVIEQQLQNLAKKERNLEHQHKKNVERKELLEKQIGRASCRERVKKAVGSGAAKEKQT